MKENENIFVESLSSKQRLIYEQQVLLRSAQNSALFQTFLSCPNASNLHNCFYKNCEQILPEDFQDYKYILNTNLLASIFPAQLVGFLLIRKLYQFNWALAAGCSMGGLAFWASFKMLNKFRLNRYFQEQIDKYLVIGN